MADLAIYGAPDRDFEQALIALKKGTQLLKYSRKGKPKFRAFRLSPDETTLIWLSHGEEKTVKLSSVTRIIPGQRTAVFRRYLRPEKDYLSFSLIYNNGDRSLDLICKDKVEAEVWLAGLKSLIVKHRERRSRSDISDLTDTSGEYLPSSRAIANAGIDLHSGTTRGRSSIDLGFYDTLSCASSDVGTERTSMQLRTSTADGFRISVSSAAPSNSSAGSGQDDIESLGDLYVWGELWNDAVSDRYGPVYPSKNDMLTPKAIESNVVLDVQQIACGVHHIALVTRQGEVFTWGEESGGRLGHGTERDFTRPRLVEFLAVNNVDFVACGEYHTCAVSTSGDLFTWGDGTHNAGLLGHSTTVSHWIPKRVSGTLEGLQVLSIACGTWHSALSTSNGKLFTFGDGRFGVLGHGDRESYTYPKEVTTLNGLRTLKVACGVWHTAAIVEVMGQSGSTMTSRKLFTWGDGDKYRLGHGDKDTYLVPTCISTLIDYNFHQIACGHTLTVGLTTSGHVFSMGGTAYGQLGNPTSDGKNPCLVQENLVGEFVEVISCGAYHVAVLTARNEVFTWGRGSNGQLGHGDTEDRKIPTYVEALRDKNVKSISCGSNFTSSICIHKWVSGTDQSVCSGCRQAFGFTRKRHNCYHCGLVHCHSCSSKKALKAALAPTPGKPHRVCDNCYNKLKAAEAGSLANANRNTVEPRRSMDMREITSARLLLVPNMEPAKFLEITRNANYGSQSIARASPVPSQASQAPSNVQLKDVSFANSLHALQSPWKPAGLTAPPLPVPSPSSGNSSRSTSPYSRRPSPPPAPSPGFSRSVIESLKKTNDALKQDVTKMQSQIKSLKQKCDQQDTEIHKLQKQKKEAYASAAVESSKTKLAEEVFISIKNQLKEVEEQLPTNTQGSEGFKSMNSQIEDFLSTRRAPLLPESVKSELYNDSGATSHTEDKPMEIHTHEVSYHDATNSPRHSNSSAAGTSTRKKEQMEQFEPGVYVTYVKLSNGEKLFKRVRFSKKRFQEQQAEVWWKANKERLFRRYLPSSPRSFSSAATGSSTSP